MWPIFSELVGDRPVTLLRSKRGNRFAVHYGRQKIEGLTYTQAGCELGMCIMHALKDKKGLPDGSLRDP